VPLGLTRRTHNRKTGLRKRSPGPVVLRPVGEGDVRVEGTLFRSRRAWPLLWTAVVGA